MDWHFLSWAFGVSASIYGITRFAGDHVPSNVRDTVSLWLMEKDEALWARQFSALFDWLFGKKHFSWTRLLRSAIGSAVTIAFLWWLFDPVLGLMGTRADIAMPLGQLLLLGLAINLVADYVSLIETRWLLGRFETVRNWWLQLGLLFVDLVISAMIILAVIALSRWMQGERLLSPVEMLAGYSPYAIFFYSTFLTSIWAWAFFLSASFIRMFSRTGLGSVLEVDKQPFNQIALVAGIVVFVGIVGGSWGVSKLMPEDFDGWVCETFGGYSCTHAARLTDDEVIQVARINRACLTGDVGQCKSAFEALDEQKSPESLPLLSAACFEGNSYGACATLGIMANLGAGVEQDYGQAEKMYQLACGGQEMVGCFNLGVLYQNGHGVTQDFLKAIELYQLACDASEFRGCFNLALMYQNATGVAQNYPKAVELYQMACSESNMSSCYNLGLMYQNSLGVNQDYAQAQKFYQQACDGNEMSGCYNLASMYFDAVGVDLDYLKASALYFRSCEGGDMRGCSNIGYMYSSGLGVKRDYVKSLELYQTACEGMEMVGCFNLGYMYESALGVQRDLGRAREFYHQACDGGYKGGCASLTTMPFN